MCDLHFKFEEDQTKTAVAIESDRYFGQTNTQVISYLSNAMNCIGQTIKCATKFLCVKTSSGKVLVRPFPYLTVHRYWRET